MNPLAFLAEHVKLHAIVDEVGNWVEYTAVQALEHVAAHGALFHVTIPDHQDSHGNNVAGGTFALTLLQTADASAPLDGTQVSNYTINSDGTTNIPTQTTGTETPDPAADADQADAGAPVTA